MSVWCKLPANVKLSEVAQALARLTGRSSEGLYGEGTEVIVGPMAECTQLYFDITHPVASRAGLFWHHELGDDGERGFAVDRDTSMAFAIALVNLFGGQIVAEGEESTIMLERDTRASRSEWGEGDPDSAYEQLKRDTGALPVLGDEAWKVADKLMDKARDLS